MDTPKKLSYSEQKEYQQLEKEIQKLEEQNEELQHRFGDASLSGEEIAKLSMELRKIMDAIDEKTERWFLLTAMMEG